MSVMRVHKNKNFTVMSNHHFKEKKMSLKAKGLLSLMLSLPDDWDYTVLGLATLSKDGKEAVMTALSELEKFGYLKRSQRVNTKGQFCGVEYDIYEEPQAEDTMSENQISANQISGIRYAENASQLNTNPLRTKSIKNVSNKDTKLRGVLESVKNDELRKLYEDYVEMRESIKSPITKQGLEKLIERCERLAKYDTQKQKTLLEAAIINNWKNVFSPDQGEERIDEKMEHVQKYIFGD